VGGLLNPQQHEIVVILRENSVRLQKMIENLLSYSAVQFQKPELTLQNVDLVALVNDVIDSYALTLRSKQIGIHRDFAAASLRGDHTKLHTVMDNLLSNAIKYTPQAGHIRISIKPLAQYITLEVHDDGPGILAADHERLFEPFYRGSGTYESLVSGNGLGLSIAKEYVNAHGGNISVLPSAHGAHFMVRLPLQPESEAVSNV
jgi:two-component system sensor histidine kinase GlrK